MADRKISDLTALTTPASGDFLPIVDISEAAAASKNKRITIEELMRGMPDGTAAAPSIAFESDPNTGIYSPGADQLAISTNGVQRINIEADGDINIDSGGVFYDATNNRLGIGTTSPGELLHISSATGAPTPIPTALRIETTTSSAGWSTTDPWGEINFYSADPSGGGPKKHAIIDVTSEDANGSRSTLGIKFSTTSSSTSTRLTISSLGTTTLSATTSTAPFIANIGASEVARLDSSGRLLVGTSTSIDADSSIQAFTTGVGSSMQVGRFSNNTGGCNFWFLKSRGGAVGSNTIVQSGDLIGSLGYRAANGSGYNTAADIRGEVDGTPGVDDMPGRLVFSTTADGAASPTERLRITSAGVLQVADAGNITVGTTTGTKIGTATTQKIGFYNATPVVQPAAVADATTAVDVITQLNDLLAKLRTLGIIAT